MISKIMEFRGEEYHSRRESLSLSNRPSDYFHEERVTRVDQQC